MHTRVVGEGQVAQTEVDCDQRHHAQVPSLNQSKHREGPFKSGRRTHLQLLHFLAAKTFRLLLPVGRLAGRGGRVNDLSPVLFVNLGLLLVANQLLPNSFNFGVFFVVRIGVRNLFLSHTLQSHDVLP